MFFVDKYFLANLSSVSHSIIAVRKTASSFFPLSFEMPQDMLSIPYESIRQS